MLLQRERQRRSAPRYWASVNASKSEPSSSMPIEKSLQRSRPPAGEPCMPRVDHTARTAIARRRAGSENAPTPEMQESPGNTGARLTNRLVNNSTMPLPQYLLRYGRLMLMDHQQFNRHPSGADRNSAGDEARLRHPAVVVERECRGRFGHRRHSPVATCGLTKRSPASNCRYICGFSPFLLHLFRRIRCRRDQPMRGLLSSPETLRIAAVGLVHDDRMGSISGSPFCITVLFRIASIITKQPQNCSAERRAGIGSTRRKSFTQ